MWTTIRAAALMGGLALCGCMPVHQAAIVAPAKVSRADAYATLYGTPSYGTPARMQRAVAYVRRPAPEANIYSAEWQRREAEREAQIKRASAICRC